MVQIRTPDQRLRIFVSSSMTELAEERAAVKRAIERLHLTPVLFELGARPYPPRDLYLAYLKQSDVFIGLYGQQYGRTAPGSQVSGLEDEYLASGDMPRLVYVRSPAPDRDQHLVEMLKRVEQSGVSFHNFRHATDLARLVADDLALLVSDRFGAAPQPEGAPAVSPARHPEPRRHVGRDEPGGANEFIGRHEELAEVGRLVTDEQDRLVTLIGPGGIGKTRLAMQAAAAVAARFDTVAVAELDGISPAEPVVLPVIASALGISETPGTSLLDSVAGFVGSRRVLLVLDGFERILESAQLVAQLIAGTAQLTVLATSREPLRLTGERVIEVPPMPVPAWSVSAEALRRSDSIHLFIDRAAATGASLRLDDNDVRTVAKICQHLDGLPLAIELAASRTRTLPLDELSRLLEPSLSILTGGARDLPPRQQTMRTTIAWSYDLLNEPDRRLFDRLGVFSGSFAMDAAETICIDDRVPVIFDGISSLVDKALVRPDHSIRGQPRFTMLRVIREFANDQLAAAGDRDRLNRLHAGFYRQRVLDSASRLRRGDMRPAVEQHLADQANISAALAWFIDTRDGAAAAEMGLAIWPLWFTLGRYTEGQEAMERALEADPDLTDDSRADVRLALGMMAFERGDYPRAHSILEPARQRYVQRGDARGVATALVALGVIADLEHPGDGDPDLNRAVDGMRSLDDRWGLAFALLALGTTLLVGHREADAIAPLEESASIFRAGQDSTLLSNALIGLGRAHMGQHDVSGARDPLSESVELALGLANRETTARALDAFAAMAEQTGDASRAAKVLGAADGIRRSVGADVWAIERAYHDETTTRLRAGLGADTFDRLAREGATLALDDVLDIVAGVGPQPPAQ